MIVWLILVWLLHHHVICMEFHLVGLFASLHLAFCFLQGFVYWTVRVNHSVHKPPVSCTCKMAFNGNRCVPKVSDPSVYSWIQNWESVQRIITCSEYLHEVIFDQSIATLHFYPIYWLTWLRILKKCWWTTSRDVSTLCPLSNKTRSETVFN